MGCFGGDRRREDGLLCRNVMGANSTLEASSIKAEEWTSRFTESIHSKHLD